MLREVTRRVLLDRNTMYSPIIHRIHGYWYCLLFMLLYTVYLITVTVIASSQYSSNMILIVLTELNNNVNG